MRTDPPEPLPFGWLYLKIAVPINVLALAWVALKRKEAWPRVGVAVAVDALMSVVFLVCGFIFFLWLTQGHYS